MFKKRKKSGEEKSKSQKQTGNSHESSSKQLAVTVHNKTATTAINYIMNKAPSFLPKVVSTAKSITPKLKKPDKTQIGSESKDESTAGSIGYLPSSLTKGGSRSSRSLNELKTEGEHVSDHQRRPSEPTPIISQYNNYNNRVPAIIVDGVSSTESNVNVIKEGYLKKIDFDSKPSLTSRGWKVYEAILKGSKLYFYKPPSEEVLKTFFPNNKDIKDIYPTHSPVIANDRGIHLNPSNFEANAAKLIFEGGINPSSGGEIQSSSPLITKYYYGEAGREVDRSAVTRLKKYVLLLIFEDNVVICKCKFVRYTRLMDAIGLGGGNHSSINAQPSSNGGVEDDTRSISSTRGITDNDGSTTNKGKGYYTKWKLDACYPIHSVEVIDPNFQETYSPYITPSQPSRINDVETSSLHSISSLVSITANSSEATLHLNIIDGHDKDNYRVFVVPSNEVRSLWEAKLFDAKKKSLKKIMIQQGDADQRPSYDQSPLTSSGTDKLKFRVFWGTGKHPELIIKEVKPEQTSEYDNVSATTSPVSPSPVVGPLSQRLIRGGLVDSLIHELMFETQKGPKDNDDEFLHAFLLTYHLFADPSHIFRELRRCGNMQSSQSSPDNIEERKKSDAVNKRLFTILFIWCKNYGRDLSRDKIYNGMMETVEEVLIKKDIAEGEELKKLIQETHENLQNATDDNMEDQLTSLKDPHGPLVPLSIDLSNLLVTGLTPALFLKMVPEELAQQLYIYHFLEFKKKNPGQDLKSFVPSKHRPESLTSPLSVTPTTPHFITRLIYHHVLTLTQQPAYTSHRPKLLIHWIETGIACKALGDMTGWISVALAICSPAIVRLKETWRHVSKKWVDIVINDWVPLLIKCGGVDGEIDIGNVKSLLLVEYDKKETSKTRPVPYFGYITLAIEQLNSNIQSVIGRSANDANRVGSRNNSISGSGVVNFEKYWKMYDTIIESLAQWRQTENSNGDTCPFSPSSPLQKYFRQLNSVPASSAHDTSHLFDSSLNCEPRLHGQYLEHHARQRKTHSTYVPLVFTEVIPTNRLFEKNAFLNASGAISKRASNSSLNIGDNNPTIPSSGRPTISGPTPQNLEALPAPSSKGKLNSSNNLTVQRSVRKRTLSFPPAKHRIGPLTSTTWNTGLDLVTRSWLGGLVQHCGSYTVLKCMKDIAGVGEMLMFVKDGELVLKSVRDATGSRPASLVENSSGTSSKRNSTHGLVALTQQNSPRTSIHNSDYDALMVVIKAGTLERLVDVLINGVASYSTSVFDDNGEPPLIIGKQGQLGINSEEYLSTFFSTYRSFCSPISLLDTLRKRFINAKKLSKDGVEYQGTYDNAKTESVNYDWNMIATTQSKILKVFHYWINEFFYDFLDDLTLRNRLMHFIDEAKTEVENWSKIVTEKPLVTLVEEVKYSLSSLKRLAATKSLEPAYDFQDEKMVCSVDKVMNDSYKVSSLDNDNNPTENDDGTVIPSTDDNEVCDLLDSIDLTILRLFEAVTPQDWILAYEILETQSSDTLGWYPKKQSSYGSDEEILITDIFITIQQAERVGNYKEYVLNSLPRSIRALCRMHNIIRNWTIQEITSVSIELDKRVNRINKFLDMILLSRRRMAKLDIYPKDETSKQDVDYKRGVPSFIESSVVSGLISPESRYFSRAWIEVSQNRKGGLDTLDSLLQSELSKSIKDVHLNFALVPCVGWLFERMLEICCNIPDMSFESEKLINYDKRRYVYNLTQIFVRLQHELTEREINPSVDVRYLTNTSSQKSTSKSDKSDLRYIKDFANKENNRPKPHKLFSKLIAEQQEKIKRDQKERDKLAKDMRETQNKLQKKSKTHQRPRNKSRVESFIKTVARPLSIAFGNPRQYNLKNEKFHIKSHKAALVINLNASEASSDFGLALDSVFRIVTEEGGLYLFQALDNDNMNDWIRVINEAAKEGAEKRQTFLDQDPTIVPIVHKEEEAPNDEPTRNSVYGKDLRMLMPDGRIPVFVEKCITEIEKRGLREVGIYRIPGAANAVNKLRAAFNKNADAVNLSDEYRDINVVAGALKRFFRDLPEPLITYELYDEFIEAIDIEERNEKLYAIKDLLYRLPKPNYELLKRLIEHLERVTDFEELNHMYANNLAIVFGPNLFRSKDFAKSMSNVGKHSSIVRCLILTYHWFFDIEEEAEEASEIEDDSLDPDIETSEPEGENDRPTQENITVTDDDGSSDIIISENEPTNEPNYDELNSLANERHLWERTDGEITEQHEEERGEEHEENSEENSQESSKRNIDQIILEHDINNIRDSTLTDVTEDLEGELELSLQEPDNTINTINEQHNVPLEHSDIIFEVNNRDSVLTNVTNESTVESVKNEGQKEQDNGTLQNLNYTSTFDDMSKPTTNLTEKINYAEELDTSDDISKSTTNLTEKTNDAEALDTSDDISKSTNFTERINDAEELDTSDGISKSTNLTEKINDAEALDTSDDISKSTTNLSKKINDAEELDTSDDISTANLSKKINDAEELDTSDDVSTANLSKKINNAEELDTSDDVSTENLSKKINDAEELDTSDDVSTENLSKKINDAEELDTSDDISKSTTNLTEKINNVEELDTSEKVNDTEELVIFDDISKSLTKNLNDTELNTLDDISKPTTDSTEKIEELGISESANLTEKIEELNTFNDISKSTTNLTEKIEELNIFDDISKSTTNLTEKINNTEGPKPTKNLAEQYKRYRDSVYLIDFDTDFEIYKQQLNTGSVNLLGFNEHLMDNMDNYIENESTLVKPLQPGKYVRQNESASIVSNKKINQDSTIEHGMNDINGKSNSLFDIEEWISKRKSMAHEPEITNQNDLSSIIFQQEKEETRVTQRPPVENVVNSKFSSDDYNQN